MLNSVITVVAVFVAMLMISIWTTLIVIAFCFLIFVLLKKVAGSSSRYFIKQQAALGDANGYI